MVGDKINPTKRIEYSSHKYSSDIKKEQHDSNCRNIYYTRRIRHFHGIPRVQISIRGRILKNKNKKQKIKTNGSPSVFIFGHIEY